MEESIPFGSRAYLLFLALLLLARGMDLLSTWVATPNLVLEGNPLAKRLGWKLGGLFNLVLCFAFASWPMAAVIIATAGFLVAAHNFKSAWLMRSLGEEGYRDWFVGQITQTPSPLYWFCLLGQTGLTALIGGALLAFSPVDSIPFAIGLGIVAFAVIVLFYTGISVWRIRR